MQEFGLDGESFFSRTAKQPNHHPSPSGEEQWGRSTIFGENIIGCAVAGRVVASDTKADRTQPIFSRSRNFLARAVSSSDDDHDHDSSSFLLRLPTDLLLAIMEASSVQLHTYLSLLGLSHATRTSIRGTPPSLSFDLGIVECSGGASPVLTADALAAIVGPCKALIKLTLPARPMPEQCPPLVECGLTDAACLPWVNEAFAGHRQLAVLHVLWAEPLSVAIRHIFKHLPGLEELRFLHVLPIGAQPLQCEEIFSRLHSLSLTSRDSSLAAQLIAASQATLQSVSLEIDQHAESFPQFLAALGRLPHLTSLTLRLSEAPGGGDAVLGAIMPMINRLEWLDLQGGPCAMPVSINSNSLRSLSISMKEAPLTLTCPTLEVLALSEPNKLVLACPRLRSIEILKADSKLDVLASMPHLEEIHGPEDLQESADTKDYYPFDETDWLPQVLAAASPSRLSRVSDVCVEELRVFKQLWNLGALTHLEVNLFMEDLFHLHLPGHIQSLVAAFYDADDMTGIRRGDEFRQLSLESQGLRALSLCNTGSCHTISLSLRCPALTSLNIKNYSLTALEMVDDISPSIRSFRVEHRNEHTMAHLDGCLLAVLVRHSDHLRHVALRRHCYGAVDAGWSSLNTALGMLPRLTSLELIPAPSQEMSVAFPHLRRLVIGRLRSLVIDCPLLEELWIPFDPQKIPFTLTRPAPNLRVRDTT
ncbi:hypothetical protein PAPYR_3319 [Paratrimastix pyriformis]|uniref:F-box domain-containing protein n=1 Tax=Paratrimastix pyriformis TaxID=342808 RepID=A0ABQ8UPC8_9EUKA|nr:hypothetical protein PAPYR_3319 [Paratrimastix pyriformis]